jgi:hypothetical protein
MRARIAAYSPLTSSPLSLRFSLNQSVLGIWLIFIADAIQGLNAVEQIIMGTEFPADAFNMAIYGTVLQEDIIPIGSIHQLVSTFDMPWTQR